MTDKLTDAIESIEMLEYVRDSIVHDLHTRDITRDITILHRIEPESLIFVINHAITTIKWGAGVRDCKDHTQEE